MENAQELLAMSEGMKVISWCKYFLSDSDRVCFVIVCALLSIGMLYQFSSCGPFPESEYDKYWRELYEDARTGNGERCFALVAYDVDKTINPYLKNGWKVVSVTPMVRAWEDSVIVLRK